MDQAQHTLMWPSSSRAHWRSSRELSKWTLMLKPSPVLSHQSHQKPPCNWTGSKTHSRQASAKISLRLYNQGPPDKESLNHSSQHSGNLVQAGKSNFTQQVSAWQYGPSRPLEEKGLLKQQMFIAPQGLQAQPKAGQHTSKLLQLAEVQASNNFTVAAMSTPASPQPLTKHRLPRDLLSTT